MQRPQLQSVTLNDVLITEELSGRSPRPPNWHSQAQAMQTLARQMANNSETLFQSLVDIAVELCQAGTAGVSLLKTTPNGEEIFSWNVLAGTLSQYVGGTTPRHFSPCGVCLDLGTHQLFSHPERYFTYFQEANTPIVEGLVLPLIADDRIFGTIWILSHDEQRHFDPEDVRIMTSLADFMAVALLLHQRQTKELLAANAALEAEIAERKQTEEKLRELEERSRALIENLPGGAVFVVDRELRYLLAEGEALSAAGFKPEDLVGQTIFEVLSLELAANYAVLYRQALAGEPFEYEHDAHDRSYVSRGTPLRSPTGEVYGVLAVSYDITDRKQTELALQKSEEKYRTLFENINDGFCIIEMLYDDDNRPFDYRFLEVSPSFETHTGWVQATGKTARKFVPNLEAELIENYNLVATTGEPVHFEISNELYNLWLDVYAFPYEKPESRQVAIVFTNIDDRKQAEAARILLVQEQAARFEAEQASQMKDEFLAMVSHELQSPLVAILGWTRLLRANPPTSAMLTKSLETIERNATLQAKLIQDLLDISRITVGKLRLSLQPVELQSIIEIAIAAVETAAIAQNIKLKFGKGKGGDRNFSPPPLKVMGNSDYLQRVIGNILSNAIKFTPKGGRVEVQLITDAEALYLPPKSSSSPQNREAKYAQIIITDTGIGISEDFLPHIFDRFRQAEKSGSAGGLGLGLAIARQLVELHNGTIHAYSAGEGQGATFVVRLPLLRE